MSAKTIVALLHERRIGVNGRAVVGMALQVVHLATTIQGVYRLGHDCGTKSETKVRGRDNTPASLRWSGVRKGTISPLILASFSTLCTIQCDTSGMRKPRKWSLRGRWYEVHYDLVLQVGFTDLRAWVSWKEKVSVWKVSSIDLD